MKNYWLYVLKLKQGKYYVGITAQRNPYTRIQQHKVGFYSAQWVKKYRYKETLEIRNLGKITTEEAEKEEQLVTSKLMKKYGDNNVRGGVFNYSGEYVKRFGRYFIEDSWENFLFVIFLLLVILYLTLDKYNFV